MYHNYLSPKDGDTTVLTINVVYHKQPIPSREYDWQASLTGTGRSVEDGWGASKKQAIARLMAHYAGSYDE